MTTSQCITSRILSEARSHSGRWHHSFPSLLATTPISHPLPWRAGTYLVQSRRTIGRLVPRRYAHTVASIEKSPAELPCLFSLLHQPRLERRLQSWTTLTSQLLMPLSRVFDPQDLLRLIAQAPLRRSLPTISALTMYRLPLGTLCFLQ